MWTSWQSQASDSLALSGSSRPTADYAVLLEVNRFTDRLILVDYLKPSHCLQLMICIRRWMYVGHNSSQQQRTLFTLSLNRITVFLFELMRAINYTNKGAAVLH